MVIAQTILDDAQNRPAEPDVAPASIGGEGGIAIVINRAEPGAPPVQVSYPGTQLQTVDSIISTLSQMGYKQGFDYSFDVAYLAGTTTPAITLNFWYPRQGRTAAEVDLVIEAHDCVDWSWDEDSTRTANLVWETGSGSGGLAETLSTAPPGYPLLETVIGRSQLTSAEVLANAALDDLSRACYPVTTPTLTLPVPIPGESGEIEEADGLLTFGDFLLGDDVTFRVDPVAGEGENVDPRFPEGLDFSFRITNWTCNVADQGLSTLSFVIGTPPVETIPPPEPPLG